MYRIKKYRLKWLRWHKEYERYSTKQLKSVFETWISNIDWENINNKNYKRVIRKSIDIEVLKEAYYNIYSKIGRVHSKRIIKEIERSKKDFYIDFFNLYTRQIVEFLRTDGSYRITTVSENFFEYIVDILTNRFEDNITIREASKEIQEVVNKPTFYRWQAERIARTETTSAANRATWIAGETSGFVMEKIWISAQDKRTRRKPSSEYDHFEMNGKTVNYYDKFIFNKGDIREESLLYPGDITGSAQNIINCRCAIAIIPKRDENGELISI